ncbi:transcriptional regulator, Fis family [Desulforamulus reducens MI-1]|uniref:Transcriptional regulator, Fis family n=1 Tax=Desulforamulus reducens (strain ATCC BAA-1160 / DSM 100696 / MI-1) TaxID=349161 RepID=A4J1B7_DESRM|nr:hypothetical protein [Desulforamulus reducens]ABO48870.1 transcriptional regulator, Fis family [Desulforamulus reducens MI-1]
MLKISKKIVGLAIGGMFLAGSIAGNAFADSDTKNELDQKREQYYQKFVADFATNLGVSQDQVTAALKATKKQMVQAEVQQGKITQAQADKILEQKEIGFSFGFGMGGPRHDRGDLTQNTNFLNDAASALGITADELKSELQSGKKLDQVITDQGMTMEQFRQKMPQPKFNKKDAATKNISNQS